jgi:hypothetical protein
MKHRWQKFSKWLWANLQVFCEVSKGDLTAYAWFTGVEWRTKKLLVFLVTVGYADRRKKAGFSCNFGLRVEGRRLFFFFFF